MQQSSTKQYKLYSLKEKSLFKNDVHKIVWDVEIQMCHQITAW